MTSFRAIVADNAFFVKETEDGGHYAVLHIRGERGEALAIKIPRECLFNIAGGALALAPQETTPADGIKRRAGFRYRDSTAVKTAAGVMLRLGFDDNASINVHIPQDVALGVGRSICSAASDDRPAAPVEPLLHR